MKLTEKQMIEIIDKRLVDKCSMEEKLEILAFASSEDFLRGKARERVDSVRAKEIHRRNKWAYMRRKWKLN